MDSTQNPRACRCGTHLARDNRDSLCATCRRTARDVRVQPPVVPREFWDHPTMREALDTWHMGKVIRAFRLHPHHGTHITQEVAGGWAGISQPHLNRIENGKPEPNLDKLIRWANILGVPHDLLWFKVPGSAKQHSSAPIKLEPASLDVRQTVGCLDERDDVHRREFLTSSLTTSISSIVPHLVTGQRVGSGMVTQLRHRVARLRRLDDFLGGADTYRLYDAELNSIINIYKDNTHAESTSRDLLALIAEQSQQTGWAAFDAGRLTEAQKLFQRALSSAREAGDRSLEANSLAYLAYQEVTLGKSGVETATVACKTVDREAPISVQALLFERLAWAHAKMGQSEEAEKALARAAEVLTETDDRRQPDWAFWVDDREIKIMSGRCWAELRRPMRSVLTLEDALASFDDTHARDKALYLSWLADAYLDVGEVEQSASVINRAMDLAVGVGSVRPQQRIQEFTTRLKPHRKLSLVADVLGRAAS